jgi:hypothetical protein
MSQVQKLERQLEDSKKLVEVRDMVLKLSQNREFKKVIHDLFMVQEAARMVGLSADPALPANERADALNMAQAAGHLKRWLSVQVQMGNVAARDLGAVEEALAEARVEEQSAE